MATWRCVFEACRQTPPLQYLSYTRFSFDIAVLTRLYNSLDISKFPKVAPLILPAPSPPDDSEIQGTKVIQSYVWPRIGKFFRLDDIVFEDGRTTNFGLQDVELLEFTNIMQNHRARIGYVMSANFGGAMAKRDLIKSKTEGWNGVKGKGNGRDIFITGEVAMQRAIQEVGRMTREGLDILMSLLNSI